MEMREERIPKKMLHTKMEAKRPRGRPTIRWVEDIDMRRKNWEKQKKTGSGRIEMAGDYSIIVDPYLWNGFKIDVWKNILRKTRTHNRLLCHQDDQFL